MKPNLPSCDTSFKGQVKPFFIQRLKVVDDGFHLYAAFLITRCGLAVN